MGKKQVSTIELSDDTWGIPMEDSTSPLVRAFNQWLSDWQRNPDEFLKNEDEAYVHAGNIEDHSYGARCVRTLNRYLEQQS